VSRADETWTGFLPQLGPSKALHAAYYGKTGQAIGWAEYAQRYLEEMRGQTMFIRGLAEHVRAGQALTLLCSSACTDERFCHRSLLRGLIEAELAAAQADAAPRPSPVLRRKS
jgi:uncharacterized protein YeaO (DUF488 family)